MSHNGRRQVLGHLTSVWDDPMVEKFHDGVKAMMRCTYCNELSKREWVCNPTKMMAHLVGSRGRAFQNARIFPSFVSNAMKTFYLGRPNKNKRGLQIALWWYNTLITYKMRPLKVCQKIFGNMPFPLSMNLTHYFEVMTTSSRCGHSVEGLSKCIFYYAISIIYESNASFRSYGNVVTRRPPWPVRAEQCCQCKGPW